MKTAPRQLERCTACTALRFCPVHAGDVLRGARRLRETLRAKPCPSCGCGDAGQTRQCAIVISPATADTPAEVGQCVPAGVLGLRVCSACSFFREYGLARVLVVALALALALLTACGGAAFEVGALDAGDGGALDEASLSADADASPESPDGGDASPRSSRDGGRVSPVDGGDGGRGARDGGAGAVDASDAGDPCTVDPSGPACGAELLELTCGGRDAGQACLAQNDGGAFVGALVCNGGNFSCGGVTCLDGCAVGQACSYSVGVTLTGSVYDCP